MTSYYFTESVAGDIIVFVRINVAIFKKRCKKHKQYAKISDKATGSFISNLRQIYSYITWCHKETTANHKFKCIYSSM